MTIYKCSAKSKYIEIRGLKFHYLEWENKNKPIIFMLHGFMDHAHSFDLLSDQLKNDYHIIAWDARGFGKTDHIPSYCYYYFFDYVHDLELFLKSFTNEPAILVGHSMGGIISSLFASIYPSKVSKIVSLEGWFFANYKFDQAPERAKLWIEGVNNLKGFKPMKDIDEATQKLLKNDTLMDKDFAKHLAEELVILKDGNLFWSHDPLHKTKSPQLTYFEQVKEFLERIECPILAIEGDSSFFDLNEFEKIIKLYKNVKRLKIKNAGHNLHIHQPKEIAENIIKFLSN